MVANLKYYENERQRHQAMWNAKIFDQDEIFAIHKRLCNHYNLPVIPLRFSHGKRSATYRLGSWLGDGGGKRKIRYDTKWCAYLTIAHEFAHYVDHMKRVVQIDALRQKQANNLADSGIYEVMIRKVMKLKWHSSRHASIVDQIVKLFLDWAIVKTGSAKVQPANNWVPLQPMFLNKPTSLPKAAMVNPVQVKPASTNLDAMRRNFWDNAPSHKSCPRCCKVLPKDDFGMRVINPLNNPKVCFQSLCKVCRNS